MSWTQRVARVVVGELIGVLVLLGAFVWFSLGSGDVPLLDRDEARYAESARQIAAGGNPLIPEFNGDQRTKKPVLMFWLMAASFSLFGVTAYAARLPTILCAALTAWLLARFARERAGGRWRPGVIAAVAFAVNPIMAVQGRLATIDLALTFVATIAMLDLYRLLVERGDTRLWYRVALAIGIGVLLKGPVIVAFTVLPVALFLLVHPDRARRPWLRERSHIRRRITAMILCAGVGLSWYVAIAPATEWSFYVAIEREVISRAGGSLEGHGGPIYYYLIIILVGFFPWLFLALAASRSAPRVVERGLGRFLAVWIVVPLALFSIAGTKLPHYVLPIWAPMALLAGLWLDRALIEREFMGARMRGHGALAKRARGFVVPALFGAMVIAFALGMLVAPEVALTVVGSREGLAPVAQAFESLLAPTIIAGVFFTALAVPAAIALWRGRLRGATALAAAGTAASFAILSLFTGPALGRLLPSPAIGELVKQHLEPDEPLCVWGYGRSSLVFYTQRQTPIMYTPTMVKRVAREHPDLKYILIEAGERERRTTPEVERWLEEYREVETIEGFDIEKGRWVRLTLYERDDLWTLLAKRRAAPPEDGQQTSHSD